MDHSAIKKALLMQLMKTLTEEDMKGLKPVSASVEVEDLDEPGEPPEDTPADMKEDVAEGETEDSCEPGSKEDRLKKLKMLASKE